MHTLECDGSNHRILPQLADWTALHALGLRREGCTALVRGTRRSIAPYLETRIEVAMRRLATHRLPRALAGA